MTTDRRRWMVAVAVVAGLPAWGHAAGKAVELSVLSSPAQYVSGGDARIEVHLAPGIPHKVQLYLNGRPLQVDLKDKGDRIQAVISGLADGENHLQVLIKGRAERDSITLINHPITGRCSPARSNIPLYVPRRKAASLVSP